MDFSEKQIIFTTIILYRLASGKIRDTVVLIFYKDEAYIIVELKACCFFQIFLDFKSYGVKH